VLVKSMDTGGQIVNRPTLFNGLNCGNSRCLS